MNAVATIYKPNKYNQHWIATFGCDDGQTVSFHFDSHKEAAALINGLNIRQIANKSFDGEMVYRMHINRVRRDAYYSHASNG